MFFSLLIYFLLLFATIWNILPVNGEEYTDDCNYEFLSRNFSGGIFSSPNYPDRYPAGVRCVYTLVGSEHERVQIHFQDFDLEEGTKEGCPFDYIDIFTENSNGWRSLVDRFCGKQKPPPIISSHPFMQIIFKTDLNDHYRGFKVNFSFVDETWLPFPLNEVCGDNLITGVGGSITSPGYPHPYPPNVECTWMIRVEKSQKLLIKFLELDLGTNCGEAYIDLWNGFLTPNALPTEKVCGKLIYYLKKVKHFKTRENRAVLRFVGGSNNDKRKGFRIAWAAIHLDDVCNEFHCAGGQFCIDSTGLICQKTHRYCISNSLRCDGIPHCDTGDDSDEQHCTETPVAIGLALTIPLSVMFISLLVLLFYLRKRNEWRRKRTIRSKKSDEEGDHSDDKILSNVDHSRNHSKPGSIYSGADEAAGDMQGGQFPNRKWPPSESRLSPHLYRSPTKFARMTKNTTIPDGQEDSYLLIQMRRGAMRSNTIERSLSYLSAVDRPDAMVERNQPERRDVRHKSLPNLKAERQQSQDTPNFTPRRTSYNEALGRSDEDLIVSYPPPPPTHHRESRSRYPGVPSGYMNYRDDMNRYLHPYSNQVRFSTFKEVERHSPYTTHDSNRTSILRPSGSERRQSFIGAVQNRGAKSFDDSYMTSRRRQFDSFDQPTAYAQTMGIMHVRVRPSRSSGSMERKNTDV